MRSLDKGNMCLEKGCGFWIASLEKGSGIQPSYFVFELDSNSNCWRKNAEIKHGTKPCPIILHHMTSYDGRGHHMMAKTHHMMGKSHHMMAGAII
jgi:hypothetical protein